MTQKVLCKIGLLLATVLLSSNFIFSSITPKNYVGKVGDAMCGVKHQIGGPVECTQICVQRGSKYDLIVGAQAYTLNTKDKTVLERLSALTNKIASVKGTMNGDMIEVSSVTAAR